MHLLRKRAQLHAREFRPQFFCPNIEQLEDRLLLTGIDEGLVAYYPFDGSANDLSGHGNHATAYNDYEYVPGVLSEAIRLVGKGHTGLGGGHVILPKLPFDTMPEFSIAMWVNYEGHTTTHGESFISYGRNTFNNTIVEINYDVISRNIDFAIGQWGGGAVGVATPFPEGFENQWHHLVLRADNGVLTGFLDGQSIGSTNYVLPVGKMENVAGIGVHWFNSGGTSSNRFIGIIDDVRIYNRALSADEVMYLFSADEESAQHEVFEVIARDIAYQDWTEGSLIALRGLGYNVDETFEVVHAFDDGETGFQAVLLESTSTGPILAARGTEPTSFLSDWYTDFSPIGIGFEQFEANYGSVKDWLISVTDVAAGIFPSIVGHSLGGALTQLIASRYTSEGGRLNQVVTFNSPGISEQYADSFLPQMAASVTHYITNGDLVSMAGEEFIEGTWHRATFDDLNLINNHVLPVKVDRVRSVDGDEVVWRDRPASIQFDSHDDVTWLSSDWYFHTDMDYFLWLAAASMVTQDNDELRLLNQLPEALLFRHTTESLRKEVGREWHAIQTAADSLVSQLDISQVEAYVPEVTFRLAGLIDIKATDLRVRYQNEPLEGLRLEGRVELPILDGLTADFTDSNYVLLTDDGFELKGELSIGSLNVVPGFLRLNDSRLTLDTIENVVSAYGQLTIVPWDFTLNAGLGFADGKWNYLELGVDGLNWPIPGLSATFLQEISGRVDHISDSSPVAFGGSLGLTLGPELSVQLPGAFGGSYSGSLLALDVSGELDRNELRGSGELRLIEGLSTLSVDDSTLNWRNGTLEVDGSITMLAGLIEGRAHLVADSQLNLDTRGTATVGFPTGMPVVGGKNLLQGDYQLSVTNDGDKQNDYVQAWSVVDFPLIGPLQVGFRVNFAGHYEWLGLDELLGGKGTGEGETTGTGEFKVDEDESWVLVGAEWEGGPTGHVVLTTPDGIRVTELDIANRPDMAIATDLSTDHRRVVVIQRPETGIWSVAVESEVTLSNVSVYAHSHNDHPVVTVTNVSDSHAAMKQIAYHGTDDDSSAVVSLFYDTDAAGFDGWCIVQGLPEANGAVHYWDTSQLPDGEYFIYAMIDDGVNVPVFAYAAESVTVRSPGIQGRIWFDVDGNGSWDGDEQGMPGVAVYLDLNGDGVLNADEPTTTSRRDDPLTVLEEEGLYTFTHLAHGTYDVRQIEPRGFVQSSPILHGGYTVDVTDGSPAGGRNFGNRLTPASIRGVVWSDQDRDGIREDGETVLSSMIVQLLDESLNAVAETSTNGEGSYAFADLLPGGYSITVTPRERLHLTKSDTKGSDAHDSDLQETTGISHAVMVDSGVSVAHLDAGLYSEFQNPQNRLNVNDDKVVSPLDVLLVIRWLNALASGTDGPSDTPYPDVNGDAYVSPIDVLTIIRHLNDFGSGDPEGESPFADELTPTTRISHVDHSAFTKVEPVKELSPLATAFAPEADWLPSHLIGLPQSKVLRDLIWERNTDWDDEDLEEVLAALMGDADGDHVDLL